MDQRVVEQAQIVAGYTVSTTLSTTPLWMQEAEPYFNLVLFALGVAVGVTTLWLNIVKIKEKNK